MRVLARKLAAFAVLCGLSGVCTARDVTEWERLDAWEKARRLVEGEERILKLTTSWGESNGTPTLWAMVTTRPFEVGEGLCATEAYRFTRAEGERDFRVATPVPISQYWERAGSCDAIDPALINDFGVIANAVWVWQSIATSHVAQIIREADEILSLATPDVRCNERIMPSFFGPGVRLRLSGIEVAERNQPGVGILYTARYSRHDDNSGPTVRFTIFQERIEVSWACYWIE